MKKYEKIMLRMFLILILIVSLCNISNAYSAQDFADKAKEKLGATSSAAIVNTTGNVMGTIVGIARVVGTGVAIIMLTVLAMKYMMSAPGERAEIKKHAIPYVIGAVILFASTGILGIIADFGKDIFIS